MLFRQCLRKKPERYWTSTTNESGLRASTTKRAKPGDESGWLYDAAGNQTRALAPSGAWQRYEYDAAHRLLRIKDNNGYTLASYTYGATNQRLVSESGSFRTYYAAEGGQVRAEYTEYYSATTPQWAKAYVYLGGRLLSTLTPFFGSERVEHHHPDRLGTRLVSNPSSGTSFEQATLPFGNGLPSESTGATNRRFTSYDRGNDAGLDYAVNRRYVSTSMRD
ncbi:MAG: RHS repeat domain-containing protein [Pyrinomonadaceae bacterium]